MELPEPRWAIPNFVPEGLTILAGRPKIGKSWLGLGFAVAVACGGYAFGKVQCEEGESLFIGLEDNFRRLQYRLEQILGEQRTANLHLLTELPRIDQGGLEMLSDWLEDHPAVRLVVIDTLQKIRPASRKGADAYSEDYDLTGTLQRFALQRGVAVLVIHHTRKLEADYLLDELSGTTGLSAGADCVMMIKRTMDGHILFVTGRDVETQELAIQFDTTIGAWALLGDAKEFALSEQRRAIIELLRETGEMTTKEISEGLSKGYGAVRRLVAKMVKDGEIEKHGTKYSGNIGNTVTAVTAVTAVTSSPTENDCDPVTALPQDKNSGNVPEPSNNANLDTTVTAVTAVTAVTTEKSNDVREVPSADTEPQISDLDALLEKYHASVGARDNIENAYHQGVPLEICEEAARLWQSDDIKNWVKARDLLVVAIQERLIQKGGGKNGESP
jgi:DNA-binding Lrp family transcriptional regulator